MSDDTVQKVDEHSLRAQPGLDPDETSRVPERVEYYSGTVLTFLIVAMIGFSIGAVAMMLILS